MGKGRRKRAAQPDNFLTEPFVARPLTEAERLLHPVAVMLECVERGELRAFHLGWRGHHVSSHVVLSSGKEDLLSARHKENTDVKALVEAHLIRLVDDLLGHAVPPR